MTPDAQGDAEPMTCADAHAALKRQFPVGSIVYLVSGGPAMTVTCIGTTDLTCAWFENASLEDHDFDPAAITQTRPRFNREPF